MKIVRINTALKRLRTLNDEIRYLPCFEEKEFSSGLIAFRSTKTPASQQIMHRDKDVLCQVLQGSGRLRMKKRKFQLRAGMICHIPKGTPHDFTAGKKDELVLFYSLIKT